MTYNYAKTPQFQAHLEAVYGSSLQEFFNDWVYNQGYPIYDITVSNSAAGQALITVNQTQSDPSVSFFEMPVPITLYDSIGTPFEVIVNNTINIFRLYTAIYLLY